MALGTIAIKVDEYLLQSRIKHCETFECDNHEKETTYCKLKEIELDETGKCQFLVLNDQPEKKKK